jgi:hypothetical protein
MLSAENRVLITKSLQNPMLCADALLAILQDQLPNDFDFVGAIQKLNLSDLAYNQLSSMLSIKGLPAVVEFLEDRLEISFAELREKAEKFDASVNRVSEAVEQWKATRPEYHQTARNRQMLLAFIENPEQFGYYTGKDGIVRYNRDGSTPASRLAAAEKNLANLQNMELRSKTAYSRLAAAKSEVERLRSEAMISRANSTKEITVKNLEIAYTALMAAGKLEEKPSAPAPRYVVGQQDPTTLADGDTLPRKKVASMASLEYKEHLRDPKFTEKMDGSNPTIPTKTSPGARALTDETKRELLAEINRMPSPVYEKWLQDPNNSTVVNELFS